MSGSFYPVNLNISGSGRTHYDNIVENPWEDLWNRMYIRPMPVIIQCGHCDSHNAISNSVCVQCGAPMGHGKRISYA